MHAVLITFESGLALDDSQTILDGMAVPGVAIAGCLTSLWLRRRSTLGSFHVFTSADMAEEFLAGDALADLMLHPDLTDFKVEQFSVLQPQPAAG